MPVLMENPLPSGPARMKHRSVWHGLMGSWDISFSRMLKYSVFYTVQSFDVFDNIEGSPLQQVMNENTTLGVISALLFSTLFSMALDQESMKRFSGSQQWILEDLGNFSFFASTFWKFHWTPREGKVLWNSREFSSLLFKCEYPRWRRPNSGRRQ